jgi:DNA-binding NarL/FixJ family response regulator
VSRPPEPPGTHEPVANPVRPIHVLVVDADARVLTALRATVSSEPDLELLVAVPDAATALASDPETRRVVALVDVSGAREDDLRLVHLLSRRPGWRVVAMSVGSGLREASRAAGAAAFVVKGEDVETVLSAIRTVAPGT